MTATWRTQADSLVADLRRVFASRLWSVSAYGPSLDQAHPTPVTCLALVETLGLADLDECARLVPGWERRGIATPLVLPLAEFLRSVDAFPLEYSEMARTRVVLFGSDPFETASIDPHDVRRACETQVKSHLMHLREGYMEAGGRPHAIAQLVVASASPFAMLLRSIGRLNGLSGNGAELPLQAARFAGLDEATVDQVLGLEHPKGLQTSDAARLFPAYLDVVERLAHAVDQWRT